MTYYITDLFADYIDEEFAPEESGPFEPRRIQKAVARRLAGTQRRPRRVGRTLALAAAIAAALTVSALAVYQYTIKDAVIEQAPMMNYNTANHAWEIQHADALSINGFADSPEYQAFVEWEAYQAQWRVDNPNWFADRGVDDTYHETPDNYAHCYDAVAAEQGRELDRIMEKYGLKLLAEWHSFNTERQLCRALGIDDILSDEYKTVGEYIYDNGSFRLDATTDVDGVEYWMTCTSSVKGSFIMIEGGMPTEYEEWSYTTAAGREVIVMTHDDGATVVAGLDGCFVVASLQPWDVPYGTTAAVTRAQAEALADAIDLEAINACFATERARTAAAESVAAFAESRSEAATTDNMDAGAEIALDVLGNYHLTGLPTGCYLWRTDYTFPQGVLEDPGCFSVTHIYEGGPTEITLSFRTPKEGEAAPASAASGETQTACTVGGCAAVVTWGAGNEYRPCTVEWLDTERDLLFTVSTHCKTQQEILALAESVTAEDPSLETGSAAYAARAQARQEEIDAILAEEQAEYDAKAAEGLDIYQAALERLGDYVIIAPGFTEEDGITNGVKPVENHTGIDAAGYGQDMHKCYQDDSSIINFQYERYWAPEDESSLINDQVFEGLKADRATWGNYAGPVTVNGCDGFCLNSGVGYVLVWHDAEKGLIFTLDYTYQMGKTEPLPFETILTMAESVSEAK